MARPGFERVEVRRWDCYLSSGQLWYFTTNVSSYNYHQYNHCHCELLIQNCKKNCEIVKNLSKNVNHKNRAQVSGRFEVIVFVAHQLLFTAKNNEVVHTQETISEGGFTRGSEEAEGKDWRFIFKISLWITLLNSFLHSYQLAGTTLACTLAKLTTYFLSHLQNWS